ncbi:hypothetical protein L596_022117 [Steinernema carpocapsae]|uniref:Uncharacterized protein n=1 Tax=Steinernema carpocapsae TaxID=34508 RepID=A0A4U5MKT4_STECR|nr:hypothetical protein L596_022117 [Steinernema carpocapsae]
MDESPFIFIQDVHRFLEHPDDHNLKQLESLLSSWNPDTSQAPRKIRIVLTLHFLSETELCHFSFVGMDHGRLLINPEQAENYEFKQVVLYEEIRMSNLEELEVLDHKWLNLLKKVLQNSSLPVQVDFTRSFATVPDTFGTLLDKVSRPYQIFTNTLNASTVKFVQNSIERGTLRNMILTNVYLRKDTFQMLQNWAMSACEKKLVLSLSVTSGMSFEKVVDRFVKIGSEEENKSVKMMIPYNYKAAFVGFPQFVARSLTCRANQMCFEKM